jgi:hypothetical protein
MPDRTDKPGYTPDADLEPKREDRRREGTLGLLLVFVLPVLILLTAFAMWYFEIGFGGPAIDEPEVVDPIDGEMAPSDEPTPDRPAD